MISKRLIATICIAGASAMGCSVPATSDVGREEGAPEALATTPFETVCQGTGANLIPKGTSDTSGPVRAFQLATLASLQVAGVLTTSCAAERAKLDPSTKDIVVLFQPQSAPPFRVDAVVAGPSSVEITVRRPSATRAAGAFAVIADPRLSPARRAARGRRVCSECASSTTMRRGIRHGPRSIPDRHSKECTVRAFRLTAHATPPAPCADDVNDIIESNGAPQGNGFFVRHPTAAEQQPFVDSELRIDNPLRVTAATTDCVSCHAGSRALARVKGVPFLTTADGNHDRFVPAAGVTTTFA